MEGKNKSQQKPLLSSLNKAASLCNLDACLKAFLLCILQSSDTSEGLCFIITGRKSHQHSY